MNEKEIEHVGLGRKHKVTDDHIIGAAWALFEAKGYEATTMADIAEAVGISRRSLFNYFATKEALLFPFFDEQMETLRTALIARPQGEKLLESFLACIPSLDPIMLRHESQHMAGVEVERARATGAAVRYSRDVWSAEMEDAALERLANAPDARIQAGFVGALVSQALSEISGLLIQEPSLPKDQALQRVLQGLSRLIN